MNTHFQNPAEIKSQSLNHSRAAQTLRSRIKPKRYQGGFSLLEFGLYTMLVSLAGLGIYLVVPGLMIENRITPTSQDIGSAVARVRADADAAGTPTPYTGFTTANFANKLAGRAQSITTSGSGAATTAQHKLGATGSQITCTSATVATAGDSYACTFPTVNKTACTGLVNSVGRLASLATINGSLVHSPEAATPIIFNGARSEDLCTNGDTNTIVLTFR
jgi:hypothetical protein